MPVSSRGHFRALASFLTQHTPATRSFFPLMSCRGTPDSLTAFTCTLVSLRVAKRLVLNALRFSSRRQLLRQPLL